MGLQRLAISNPSAATSTTLYTSTNQLLASVIATNKSTTTSANVTVWIQPSGSASASQYAYIVYELPIDASNSFETFRFAVNQNDVIKIQSSTASVSFSAYGMIQYDINLGVGISSYQATAPSDPITGQIWVDSDTDSFYVYNSSSWVSLGAPSNEDMQDAIAPLFNHASHTNVTATYDDASNKILLVGSGKAVDDYEAILASRMFA
jgi:hypothetical protein